MFYHDYHCDNTQKYFRLTQQNTDINNDKLWKMGTIVEFRPLVLDSLKYSSKAESRINRSSVGTLLLVDTIIYLFIICLLFFLFFFYFYFCFFIYLFFFYYYCHCFFPYIYRKQALPSYLHSDSNRCYWLA